MIPCLYNSSEKEFTTNGIGKLADCISCVVCEKRNGSYELEMEYPSNGIHAEDLINSNIILAKPADNKASQAFSIYLVTTDLTGTMKISARHISYALNFITVSSVNGASCITSLQALKSSATTNCDFEFSTDIESTADLNITEPNSMRNVLGGIDGSILDTYGGEYEWDMFNVILHKSRGSDNSVRIVYGKNLSEFEMDKDSGDLITGVHPYWKGTNDDDEEVIVELSENIIMAEDAEVYRITALDCSSEFEEEPSESELRAYAKSYLETSETTVPDIDITLDFIALWQTQGYEDIADAERVNLCDTVYVYIPSLDIEVSSKVTETEYDSLLERYNSITLSNTLSPATNSIVSSLNEYTTALVNKKLSYYTTTAELYTKFELSQGNILLEVSEIYATFAQLEEYYSKTTDETDKKLESYYTITDAQSYIKMSIDEISSVVSSTTTRVETLEDTTTGMSETITTIQKQCSEITQTIDSITLSVSSTSNGTASIVLTVDGENAGSATAVTSSRTAFANETSAITISAGTVTFSSNTFAVSSTNLTITAAGKITATGADISGNITANNLKAYGNLYFYRYCTESWAKAIDYTETTNSFVNGDTLNLYMGLSSSASTTSDCTVLRGYNVYIYAHTVDSIKGTINIGTTTDDAGGNKQINIDGNTVWINGKDGYETQIGGKLTVAGTINAESSIIPGSNASLALGKTASLGWSNIYLGNASSTLNALRIIISSTNYTLIGRNSSNHIQVGNTSYATYMYGSIIYMNGSSYSSDRRIKEEISSLSENDKYETFFDNLEPVVFKYQQRTNADGEEIGSTSGRFHTGFIAQDVLSALESSDLTSQDFAGYVDLSLDENDSEDLLCLRYEEFVALNTMMIQKLKSEVNSLKEEISLLKQ